MVVPEVTSLYAGILGLMAIAVAFPPGQLRGKLNVSVGDGGHPELLLAMRRQANFLEVVPLALIIIGLLEMNGVTSMAIHAFGVALVVARIAHAVSLEADSMDQFGRFVGAAGSALVMAVASGWAIVAFFM